MALLTKGATLKLDTKLIIAEVENLQIMVKVVKVVGTIQ